MYSMVCRVCGIVLGVSVAGAAASAASIGTVVDVVNDGYRTPPGESELVARPADELVTGEGLRTGLESSIHVQFSDGSELSVEADSEILLSDYVFQPTNGTADGTIMLGEGMFHFDSNGASDSGIELQTPVATIGIRGTEFLVTVANGATIVDVVDGAVEITPARGGKAVTCEGGQSGLVAGEDIDAICGDFGSFSTAAGVPAEAPSLAQGKIGDNSTDSDRPDKSSAGRSGGGSSGGGTGGNPGGGSGGGTGGNPGGGSGGGGTGGNPGGDPGGGTGGNPGGGGGGNSGGHTNHSGQGDGTNPGKGHDNGNGGGNGNGNGHGGGSGGNGGSNNPGGGKK